MPRRWLAPLLIILAAGAAGAACLHLSHRVDPAALKKRQEGLSLLLRDDNASLEKAAAALSEAARLDPKLKQAQADRSLCQLLLSAGLREEATALEARLLALDGGLARLRAEADPGWQGREEDVIEAMKQVEAEVQPVQQRALALRNEALRTLRPLAGDRGEDLAVARALAVAFALEGNTEESAQVLRNAHAAQRSDPWLDLAEAAVDGAGASSRPDREAVVERMETLAARHPDLLRARLLLARAQADLGRVEAAVATLDGLLAANSDHDRAQKLKAELLSPPPLRAVPAPVPGKAPPPGKPGNLPRKGVTGAR